MPLLGEPGSVSIDRLLMVGRKGAWGGVFRAGNGGQVVLAPAAA